MTNTRELTRNWIEEVTRGKRGGREDMILENFKKATQVDILANEPESRVIEVEAINGDTFQFVYGSSTYEDGTITG